MKPLVPLLFVALIVSAMSLVYIRQQSRLAFIELHELDRQRDALDVEYGRLLLERATWSLNDMVAREAAERLSMHRPDPDSIVTLAAPGGGDR